MTIKVIAVYPRIIQLIMLVMELCFHHAEYLQQNFIISPDDEIPEYHHMNVYMCIKFLTLVRLAIIMQLVLKINTCLGMMTNAIREHWWAYLFCQFIVRPY